MSEIRSTPLDSFLKSEGDTLDPDRLTEVLGVTPVHSEPPRRIENDLDGAPLDELVPGQWIAHTLRRLQSISVDEHLQFLLDLLVPHQALLRELAASPGGRVWLGLEIAPSTEGTIGLRLDHALYRTIRDLGADIWEAYPGEIPGGIVPPPAQRVAAAAKRESEGIIGVEWLDFTQTCILVSRLASMSLAADLRR